MPIVNPANFVRVVGSCLFTAALLLVPVCGKTSVPPGCAFTDSSIVIAPPDGEASVMVASLTPKPGVSDSEIETWMRERDNAIALSCNEVSIANDGDSWKFYVRRDSPATTRERVSKLLAESQLFR